jgi:hypothetical protein
MRTGMKETSFMSGLDSARREAHATAWVFSFYIRRGKKKHGLRVIEKCRELK